MKYALLLNLLFLPFLGACSASSTACTTTADCFENETCVDGQCTNESVIDPNRANSAQCLAPVGGCSEDMYEPNDSWAQGLTSEQYASPWESNSWCEADEPLMHKRTMSGTHCPENADVFRFPIQAGACVSSLQLTINVTVEIDTTCDASVVDVVPYTFFRDPVRNDLCDGTHDDVRCTVEDGGRKRLFQFLQPNDQNNQLWDWRIAISSQEDVAFDYDVTVELVF